MAAASMIVTAPLVALVVVFQRRIVAGLTAGAVKGSRGGQAITPRREPEKKWVG
jgi:hypothetical protein